MKKSQLIPIVLIFMSVLSIYYLFDSRITLAKEYSSALSAARTDADNGVMVKAVKEYSSAIELNSSVDLYIEVAEKYLQNDDYYAAKRWYERNVLSKYPNDEKTYAFGIRMYIDREDYTRAYETYATFQKRKLKSEEVEQLIDSIQYKYLLRGSYTEVKPFTSAGVAAVNTYEDEWVYIDSSGYSMDSSVFEYAESMIGEYAAVVKNGEAFFINDDGDVILTADYFTKANSEISKITAFKDIQSDLVLGYDGTSWNYFDLNTYRLLFGGYKEATPITLGVGAVTKTGVDWALIDKKGNEITGYVFNSVVLDERGYVCRNDSLLVEKNSYYVLIDKKGNELTSAKYTDAHGFNDNTLAAVEKDGKWIFIDTKGNEYDLGSFEEAHSFCGGLAAVRMNNRWGYIDMNGDVVIPCQYEDAMMINADGLGFVKDSNHKWKMLKLYSSGE